MNHSDSQTESEDIENHIDFGSVLASARRAKNYSVEEISEFLKIPAQMISALENNNIGQLPAPTYTQGYIRAYAKFLEISEDTVLERYNHAVPHEQASDLKPRSNLPDEANSQSPLIKLITIVLLLSGIAALIFGSFQYYQEKAGDIEHSLENKEQSFTGASLDSPGEHRLMIKQSARFDESNDQLILDETEDDMPVMNASVQEDEVSEAVVVEEQVQYNGSDVASAEIVTAEVIIANDSIEFFAGKDSWMEVHDANNTRLFYNILKAGKSKVLKGRAPFRITMGNAKTTYVVINDLNVDVSDYIRPSNTAVFSVSTEDDEVVFH